MRGTAGAPHRFVGLSLGLFVVLLSALMAQATAADYIPRGQPIPHNVRWTGATASGVNTRVGASWIWNGTTTHHNVPVPYGSSSIGAAAKKVIGRGLPYVGWAMTLRDIVNGAGWVIDELGRQVQVPAQPSQPLGDVVYCVPRSIAGVDLSGLACVNSPEEMPQAVDRLWNSYGFGYRSGPTASGSGYLVGIKRLSSGSSYGSVQFGRRIKPSSGWSESDHNYSAGTDAVPVSDFDLGQALRDHPQVVNAVLIDPETGAPLRTSELVAALNDLRKALEAANGLPAGEDITADPTWSDPETVTPHESPWPGFCDWATTVCEFIDWVKAPDDAPDRPEVPWDETPPEPVQWSSGLGGGECPAPHQVTVSIMGYSASPTFEYTPLCTAATYLRPVLIAVATIVAAFIVAGLRQSKDA